MRGSREGETGRPDPTPLKITKIRVPYKYWSGSKGKSQSYQAGIQCWATIGPASETPFKWRFAGGAMMARV